MKYFFSILIMGFLAGCTTTNDDGYYTASYWIEYLPYPEKTALNDMDVRPTPLHTGWNDNRMNNDLRRLSKIPRLQALLVRLTPQELLSDAIWKRLGTFCRMAEQHHLSVVLYIAAEDTPLHLRRDNLLSWLEQQNFPSYPGLLRLDGRPVVVLDKNIVTEERRIASQENIDLLQAGCDLPINPRGKDRTFIPKVNKIAWIRASDCGSARSIVPKIQKEQWTIPRLDEGFDFKQNIIYCNTAGMKIIVISSWNDYANGSFIEPNSFDGDTMMKILK